MYELCLRTSAALRSLRRPINSPCEEGLDFGYAAIILLRNLVALVPIDPERKVFLSPWEERPPDGLTSHEIDARPAPAQVIVQRGYLDRRFGGGAAAHALAARGNGQDCGIHDRGRQVAAGSSGHVRGAEQ